MAQTLFEFDQRALNAVAQPLAQRIGHQVRHHLRQEAQDRIADHCQHHQAGRDDGKLAHEPVRIDAPRKMRRRCEQGFGRLARRNDEPAAGLARVPEAQCVAGKRRVDGFEAGKSPQAHLAGGLVGDLDATR